GLNRAVDRDAAGEIAKLFVEAIAAPRFSSEARDVFAAKKNLRLVEVTAAEEKWVLKHVSGGLLVQDADVRPLTEADLKIVSDRAPSAERCARCSSRGRCASTSSPMPSCTRATARRSAWAPAR